MGEGILLGTELLLLAAYLWASDDETRGRVEEIQAPLSRLTPVSLPEVPA